MKKIKKIVKIICLNTAILSFFGGIFVLLQFDEQNIKIGEYLGLPSYKKYEQAKIAFEKDEAKKNISVDSKIRYSKKNEALRCSFFLSKDNINKELLMICAMVFIVTLILSCVLYWENILSFYYDE